jgi:Fur family peroxide stress response transcriptional regulator
MNDKNGEELIATLKASGLQVTQQRVTVYQTLLASADHLSADEIHHKIKGHFPTISHGTIYNCLDVLREAGLVRQVKLADVSKFEARTDAHHHLFCVKCQTIRDIDDTVGQNIPKLPKDHGFEVLGYEITVKGICPRCSGGVQGP